MEETPQSAPVAQTPVPAPMPVVPQTPTPVVATQKSSKVVWIVAALLVVVVAAAAYYAYTTGLFNGTTPYTAPQTTDEVAPVESITNEVTGDLNSID